MLSSKGGKGEANPPLAPLSSLHFSTPSLLLHLADSLIPDSPSSNIPVLHLSTFANLSHAFHELLRVGPTLPFLLFGPYTYTINTRVPPIPRNGARLHKEGGEETIEDLEPENPPHTMKTPSQRVAAVRSLSSFAVLRNPVL